MTTVHLKTICHSKPTFADKRLSQSRAVGQGTVKLFDEPTNGPTIGLLDRPTKGCTDLDEIV